MSLIAALLGSRAFLYATFAVGLLGSYELWKLHEQHVGEAKVVTQINASAEKLAEQAVQARAPAEQPGSAARLKKSWCANCNGAK